MTIPRGFCHCGCGARTTLAVQTVRSKGRVKGQPCRYLPGHNGRTIDYSLNLYVPVYDPKRKHSYVYEHVLRAERALGRVLPHGAQVDGNRRNNANSNLVICPDAAYHRLLHSRMRLVQLGANPNTQNVCGDCKSVKPLEDFCRNVRATTGRNRLCRQCMNIRDSIYRERKAKEAKQPAREVADAS